jgi:polyisoprenyl-phosphate glycosyltransferase
MESIELSIVIPVYNSENCLEELSSEIARHLRTINYEVILVNDKSPDNSWQKILELTKVNPRIKGISLKKNSGQDNAIMAGLGQVKGQYVAIMDDDLQHSPADILKLYTGCSQGYDICYGLFIDKKQSRWKNIGSKVNDYFAQVFLKKPKGLYLSPFKVMRQSLANAVREYKGPFPYLDGIVLSLTSNITQVELKHRKRFDGKGNYSLIRSVSVFLKHVTGYSLYPLRFATIIGIVASGLSFLLGAFFVVDYLTNARRVEGWISLVLLMVFFNGLILMCLGLIGEYIGRVYLTLTSRRQYVIDKIATIEGQSDEILPV